MTHTLFTRAAALIFALFLVSGCSESAQEPRSNNQSPADTEVAKAADSADRAMPGTDASITREQSDCQLTMGWDPWAPYQYLTVNGDLQGLDVEIVQSAAAIAGCDMSFEQGDWASLLIRLRDGDIDLLTGATRTGNRETFALFSAPYRTESWVLFVRAEEVDKHQPGDLRELLETGFRIGVTEGYYYGEEVAALQGDPLFAEQFVDASIGELNYARLVDLEIDGFLEDPFVAATTLRRKGWGEDIAAHPLEITAGEVHLMFSRASVQDDVVERINEGLSSMRGDGSYQAMLDKYAR